MRNRPLQGVKPPENSKRQPASPKSIRSPGQPGGRASNAPPPKTKPRPKKISKKPKVVEPLADEMLGIIVDQRTGLTFYISLIDNFTYKNQEYAVMYNYRIEDGKLGIPEILIMRSYRDHDKQYFTSIRNEEELDRVFDVFYDRFQQSV